MTPYREAELRDELFETFVERRCHWADDFPTRQAAGLFWEHLSAKQRRTAALNGWVDVRAWTFFGPRRFRIHLRRPSFSWGGGLFANVVSRGLWSPLVRIRGMETSGEGIAPTADWWLTQLLIVKTCTTWLLVSACTFEQPPRATFGMEAF